MRGDSGPFAFGPVFSGINTGYWFAERMGVAFTNSALAASDPVLGVSGVGFSSLRQLGSRGDGMQLEPDGRTLRVDFVNADATDDVRILVATQTAVPALSFPALCALALALLAAAVAAARANEEATKPRES